MAETIATPTDLPPIIREHLDAIVGLARAYEVERLEVFGSVMTDRFDPERSDVDFLVSMRERGALDDFRRYVALGEALEAELPVPFDLVFADALRRDALREDAARTRRVIYDATANS